MVRRAFGLAAAVLLAVQAAAWTEPAFVGTTYSHRQSAYFDLDWKETYLEILKLDFYVIRLGSYWDEIEKEPDRYDFATLDWQIAEAKRRNVPVVLTVGMKAPRWPEFFIPDWIQVNVPVSGDVSTDAHLRERTLKFITKVVERYRDEPTVRYWQVENEALDRSGGRFWWIGKSFLKTEVELVRRLDGGKRPIILTAATFPNSFLFLLARFRHGPKPIYDNLEMCDILGINIYPVVGQMFWGKKLYFWSTRAERADYFTKLLKLAKRKGKSAWIMELQAEPWEPGMLVHKTKERVPSGWPEPVRESFKEFRELGFNAIFLWGAEYWYYRSLVHGDSNWWEMVGELMKEKVTEKVADWKESRADEKSGGGNNVRFFGPRDEEDIAATYCIEWHSDAPDTVVSRYPLTREIRMGSALFVRDGQRAAFVSEGRLADVYGPGRYRLSAENMPALTAIRNWNAGYGGSFRSEIYFFNLRNFADLPWSTPEEVTINDPKLGTFRLRANGSYTVRIEDVERVLPLFAGKAEEVSKIGRVESHLRQTILSTLASILAEGEISLADLAADLNHLSDKLWFMIDPAFRAAGFRLVKFAVEDLCLPADVQRTIDRKAVSRRVPAAATPESPASAPETVKIVVRCPQCESLAPERAKFCPECGNALRKKA